MKEPELARLLAEEEAAALVRSVITATGAVLAVSDTAGRRLLDASGGSCHETQQKYPVMCEGEVAGWVSGGEQARPVAALLGQLIRQESDKEALLDEILGLYREMNLLFDLSGKLARSLEPESVAADGS